MMNTVPHTPDGYQLLHDGAIALGEVEATGIRVNVPYLEKTIRKVNKRIEQQLAELEQTDVVQTWRRTYRDKTNLDSVKQLAAVLFDVMGFPSPKKTAGGFAAADEEALSTVDHPFIPQYLNIKKLSKAVNTNLVGILREVVADRVHCFFDLHTTNTYRSSSSKFNFQNLPIRDPVLGPLIRAVFVASIGNQLVETDYSGAEVCVGTCYHKDPKMIEYILDPTKDMHRDMAAELFMLPMPQITKPIRFAAKSAFVFAEFYGDWYPSCAKSLWNNYITDDANRTTDGVDLKTHLASKGINELGDLDWSKEPSPGTYVAHVKAVEKNFWGERFFGYAQWKRDFYDEYRLRTWFATLTGFVCQGYMKRNEVVNYPIQGSAFHCLLWAMIRIMRELKRRNMKSRVVGQIHDSIVGDVVPSERDEYLAICQRIMTKKIVKVFPWLIVPMSIEADVAPVDGDWSQKKGYEIKD